MDFAVLMQFNLTKFVFELDYFSLVLLVSLIASVTWIFSVLMALRFDVNCAFKDVYFALNAIQKMKSVEELDAFIAERSAGINKTFFSSLASEMMGMISGNGLKELSFADAATKKFFQRSVFSSRETVVGGLCERVDRAIVAGWGVGLLSLCAMLIRSLMLVLSRGAMLAEGIGVDRWLFGTLLYAIIGVWGVFVTNWICGFLKISVCSIDQNLKKLCWRLVLLSDKS